VDGEDRKGLGAQMARALADAGISMAFCVAQTVGRKFTAVIGFLTEEDAGKATRIIQGLRKPAKK
jgi:predicted amino acid-binding ACT domain protein